MKSNLVNRSKVLVVDDDALSHQLVRGALHLRHEVFGETEASKAVEVAQALMPQLILLDLNMPNVDGFEVLSRLRRHPVLATIPVICVSGSGDSESRSRAYRAGAAGFLLKPLSVKTLATDIENLLGAMNTEVTSIDGRRSVFIGLNVHETHARLQATVRAALDRGQDALVLSIRNGELMAVGFDPVMIEKGRLVLLEIKPTLLTRLPYLEDYGSIAEDIQRLLQQPSHKYSLFFEEPETVLNVQDQEKTSAVALSMGDLLAGMFHEVRFFARASSDEAENRHINAMAKMLARAD